MRPYLAVICVALIVISIHAPREGCDVSSTPEDYKRNKFQSTHPVRGATNAQQAERTFIEFQSTHPVRGATDAEFAYRQVMSISIHAPREGCDPIWR